MSRRRVTVTVTRLPYHRAALLTVATATSAHTLIFETFKHKKKTKHRRKPSTEENQAQKEIKQRRKPSAGKTSTETERSKPDEEQYRTIHSSTQSKGLKRTWNQPATKHERRPLSRYIYTKYILRSISSPAGPVSPDRPAPTNQTHATRTHSPPPAEAVPSPRSTAQRAGGSPSAKPAVAMAGASDRSTAGTSPTAKRSRGAPSTTWTRRQLVPAVRMTSP